MNVAADTLGAAVWQLQRGGDLVSTDAARLDLALIHDFLAHHSYWAQEIPLDIVRRSVENSLSFGVYAEGVQVGFARVISDRATTAYLADVFVLPAHRGRGLSRLLMECIFTHPDLRNLRRWVLVTADAHGLYEKFGFHGLEHPEKYMEISHPDLYQRRAGAASMNRKEP